MFFYQHAVFTQHLSLTKHMVHIHISVKTREQTIFFDQCHRLKSNYCTFSLNNIFVFVCFCVVHQKSIINIVWGNLHMDDKLFLKTSICPDITQILLHSTTYGVISLQKTVDKSFTFSLVSMSKLIVSKWLSVFWSVLFGFSIISA